ncbi:SWIM zinc finger domain-containing protein [Pseudanabaena sp. UWO310]|uniref:SWIM zinc finger family protein n=1 Tax=Pseudanabaena sp. UWO310 TaxID=2480795 RepID=UPI00115817C6|nr:SWIM zinc finger family protein [Pseudanabaena sp. UWO310]TYQ26276.1 SWIM zinc finger family protein [Pseudanabaena sp. UWO310]
MESITWTSEKVLALAPDASSAKNGKGLATLNKWQGLGRSQQVIWGECQGSGKDPYRTQIDLSEPAFRCSCPSRKFPCKHGLGLFLLLVSQPTAITEESAPQWVEDWIASRTKREEKQKRSESEKPVNPETQAKRAAARLNKVTSGVQDLQVWLNDLMRQGLSSVRTESYQFWEKPAARMIDAQAPGLARQLRDIPSIISGSNWENGLLERLGKLNLLLKGFEHLELLPISTQADIRTQIGWTQNQSEILAEEETRLTANQLADLWLVMGQQVETEDRLRISRTWLWGKQSNRYALCLQFAHGMQPFEHNFMLGSYLEAALVFFESNYPLRAVIKTRKNSNLSLSMEEVVGQETIDIAIANYSHALVKNPWLERFPLSLQQVIPIHNEGKWFIRDRQARLLPISSRFENGWILLALSGGHPTTIFGEWNGEVFLPLSIWAEGKFHVI